MSTSSHKLKILVIDDNKESTTTISEFLRVHEFEVVVTNDSMEGLEHIRQENYDIVFLDINLPVISGLGIIELLSLENNLKNQNIFVFPEDYISQIELKKLLKREGIKGFLKKPINFDELLSVISSNSHKKLPKLDISN